MSKKLTTADFIKKAEVKHNYKYDYSSSKYINSTTPLIIICPKHGEFLQKPSHHLSGHGCKICGYKTVSNKKKLTWAEYKNRVSKIHNNKYMYPEAIQSTQEKINIICPTHGLFQQNASDHLYSKAGCPECKKEILKKIKIKTNCVFLEQAKKIHGNKYQYSLVDYKNAHTKIEIICPEHGIFVQTPMGHLNGNRCPYCSHRVPVSKEEFIKRAQKIHNDRYNYSLVSFKKVKETISIICLEHGVFKQEISNHLAGSGCPKCAKYGFKKQIPAILYYLKDLQTGLYKIGITNKSLESRFGKVFCSKRAMILLEQTYENGEQAYLAEQEILQAFAPYRCTNESWPTEKGGKTEFFKWNVLGL